MQDDRMDHQLANADCLDPETLAAYLDGLLSTDAVSRADHHIDTCRACRGELSALAATHSFPAGSGSAFAIIDGLPTEGRLGRYEVLREIGRGSMGVVVRAYDPELARAVAVKVLDARRWESFFPGGTSPRAAKSLDSDGVRVRLRREAQAMARLSHPNVVAVYDVVTHGDSVCIAMELVEGATLRDHARGRPWRDVLADCIAAGRGLAAAHAARLIHRDFKPENVLCAGGRVAVTDFGLARLEDDVRLSLPLDAGVRAVPDATPVTALAGTPAYMAPELFRGVPATTASDQFSFCATTWEVLYGERPFTGATLEQLRDRILDGVPAPPATANVPAWVRAILLRGLARDPAARFGSMDELLDALAHGHRTRDPIRRRRRFARTAIAAGAGALAVVGLVSLSRVATTGPSCMIEDGDLWDRPALEAALAGRDPGAVTRVTGAFAAYARSWAAARREACEAPAPSGTRRLDAIDARLACLDRGRRQLGELAQLIAHDPQLADRAVEAVYRLHDPAACTEEVDPSPLDPAVAETDRAAALLAAGRTDDALAIVRAVVAGSHDAATRAEALLVRGRAEQGLGRLDASEATLSEALTAAERARADQLVAAIWVELVQTTGAQKHRFEAAQANARGAEAAFTRAEPGPALRARYAYAVGTMMLAQGKLGEAKRELERALVTAAETRPGERGLVLAALCDVHRQLRDLTTARARCVQAIGVLGAAYGPEHPRLAPTYNVWGALELDDGNPEAARARFARTIAILEHHGLEDDRALALALSNTAVSWNSAGEPARARPLFARARDLFAKHHPTHPQRVLALQGLAAIALDAGDHRAAIRYTEEARAVIGQVHGLDSEQGRVVLYNLALAYQRLPDLDKTDVLAEELVARSQHPGREAWWMVALALDLQAANADERAQHARSIELRERALAALDHDDRPATRAWLESQLGGTSRHPISLDDLERLRAVPSTTRERR